MVDSYYKMSKIFKIGDKVYPLYGTNKSKFYHKIGVITEIFDCYCIVNFKELDRNVEFGLKWITLVKTAPKYLEK